ncbi:Isochorismatase family [Teratosphaeria destructans]|uniref:Isochorismatase family n=1 Tax=Teratosphaeria destructans TaxID=418781 RepID=A0A9W7SWM0_9PEZI|nr:Isochorismatase family [Teratosphaeria destructans]
MASLLALLSQQTPNLQTRKGLIVTGVQNDFVSPEGKLFSCEGSNSSLPSFVKRLHQLVPTFRELGGDVIWVRTEYEADREINADGDNGDAVIAGPTSSVLADQGSRRKAGRDVRASSKRLSMTNGAASEDEELFLTKTSNRAPCCIRDSWGADYPESVKPLIDRSKDIQVTKTYYSAFGSTSLLLTLRSRLITELFLCGCNTNLSVFATAMDAARYGIKITLVEDCLGYRKKERHDEAIRQLVNVMGASVVSTAKAINILQSPPEEEDAEESGDDEGDENEGKGESDAFPHDDGLITVDSDEDDDGEDFAIPQVRLTRLPNHLLSLRYRTLRSQDAAASQQTKTATEHAKSASSRLPSTELGAIEGDSPDNGLGEFVGGGQPDVESTFDRGAGNSSIKRDPVVTAGVVQAPLNAEASQNLARESSEKPTRKSELPWLQLSLSKTPSSPQSDPTPGRSSHPGLSAMSSACNLPQSTVDEYERMMKRTYLEAAARTNHDRSTPLFGEENESDSAGSRIYYDLLPTALAGQIFEKINIEVQWQRMHHLTGEVPRLVCCQASTDSAGDKPVYRHPSDQTMPVEPWTPAVNTVRKAAEELVGHPLNHVLIQLYRGGTDFISEHSDKTLDIAKGSNIVNVSFGAQRKMKLRTKRGVQPVPDSPASTSTRPERKGYTVTMPHNSMIKMSLETNAEYLHGIKPDKRLLQERSDAEKAYEGQRISLTFRHIATFLDKDEKLIWGQGALGKTREDAQAVVNGDVDESAKLVRAFAAENAASHIDWDSVYGEGNNVLHLKAAEQK